MFVPFRWDETAHMTKFRKFLTDERGATAIEYGLIVCLIVVAVSASFPTMSEWVNRMVMSTAEALS
jgi:Flp pilus assembly pilin Flp